MRRYNKENEAVLTFKWLEKELTTIPTEQKYIVIEGYYDNWDNQKNEKSPDLEGILNFMDNKGFEFIDQFELNMSYRQLIFKRKQ